MPTVLVSGHEVVETYRSTRRAGGCTHDGTAGGTVRPAATGPARARRCHRPNGDGRGRLAHAPGARALSRGRHRDLPHRAQTWIQPRLSVARAAHRGRSRIGHRVAALLDDEWRRWRGHERDRLPHVVWPRPRHAARRDGLDHRGPRGLVGARRDERAEGLIGRCWTLAFHGQALAFALACTTAYRRRDRRE